MTECPGDQTQRMHRCIPILILAMATLSAQNHPSSPDTASIRLFLSGDVMTGRGIDQVLPHPGSPKLHESYVKDARHYVELAQQVSGPIPRPAPFDYVWGIALDAFRDRLPDLKVINLETSVTASDDFWPDKAVLYRMHPENLPVLEAAGIQCVSLANNHVLDWGPEGLEESLGSLQASDISAVGAGRNTEAAQSPAVFTVGGTRLLVFGLGFTGSGIPSLWEAGARRPGLFVLPDYSDRSLEAVREAIHRHAQPEDIVVVSIHWGGNWGYGISDAQREFARGLVDRCGVDLVHGHSSHHVKGMEVYNRKLILYGCGDLLTDYEGIRGHEAYRPDLSFLYFPTLAASDGDLLSLELVPTRVRRFRLTRPGRADQAWLLRLLNRECAGARLQFVSLPDGAMRMEFGDSGGGRQK